MAIEEIKSAVDVYWVDNTDALNDNFDELDDKIDDVDVLTLTTTATPATGTCGVQFVFTDANDMAITGIRSGIGYLSDSAGALGSAITSVATLTNGSILTIVTGRLFHWVTTADGEVGITLTGTAGSKYVTFVLPNGQVVTSTVCTIN